MADDDSPLLMPAPAATPPPAPSHLVCPECSLPLCGRIAILMPCGHCHHAQCAEFVVALARTTGSRCRHCSKVAQGARVIHAEVEAPSMQAEGDAGLDGDDAGGDLTTQLAAIHRTQQLVIEADRDTRRANRAVADLRKQAAALHQSTERLKRVVGDLAPRDGTTPASAVVSPIPANTDGLASDPFVSVSRLQHYVRDGVAAEAALRARVGEIDAEAAAAGDEVAGLRDERQALQRRVDALRREQRRREREAKREARHQHQRQQQRQSTVTSSAAPRVEPEGDAQATETAIGGAAAPVAAPPLVVVLSSSSDDEEEGTKAQPAAGPCKARSRSRADDDDGVVVVSPPAHARRPPRPELLVPGGRTGLAMSLPTPRYGEIPRPRLNQRTLKH